jgi:aminoglycoside phosphotransferase (APT) family kinase protein
LVIRPAAGVELIIAVQPCRHHEPVKMHDEEPDISVELVADLLAAQFPELAALPLRALRSTGTVNAIVRIGDDLYARLPRMPGWAGDLEREVRWLPWLGPQVPLAIPEPIAAGLPTERFPLPWAIYRWIEGEPYADTAIRDEDQAADDLAQFIGALRRLDAVADAPRAGRQPLRQVDAQARDAFRASDGLIDASRAAVAWDRALEAPPWDGTPVWIHGDLLRPNLLVRGGAIRAVIDWGAAGVGDPAMDVIPAWAVFGPRGRSRFREALQVDDGTWSRARGVALLQAAMIIPYYTVTNPAFVAMAQRTIEQISRQEEEASVNHLDG